MAEFSEQDRRILAAINAIGDPDTERPRERDETDDYDLAIPTLKPHKDDERRDPKLNRILQDQQTRQSLNEGGPQTGPKGVLADYRFHAKQEIARRAEQARHDSSRNKQLLSSGWMQRTIAREEAEKRGDIAKAEGNNRSDALDDAERQREEDEDAIELLERQVEDLDLEDPAFLNQYRARRIAEISQRTPARVHGVLRELDESTYVSAIDNEASNVTVVIHLYQSEVEACRTTNVYLTRMAQKYGMVKFCKIVSTRADENFDQVALPALLVYRGGDLTHTLIRITDEIPGWRTTGRVELEDFEDYLIRNRVVSESDITDFDSNLLTPRRYQADDDDEDEDDLLD
ncbi:hypothetical protein SmJEL517_g03393 [Synchytrium microbalum]|uniref:Phosducin domain-containing protein n=1 Tax=Synchytrium microbalum TaxID=1806994 RepID=A0A507C2A7_9FUNG|nr:uncharacterized protein SmJEL517_g03393 [Synchytrium microbalum]TPX33852.1 hypothetical protein SmJEL517_g03393 [Synchytrium microbalum]